MTTTIIIQAALTIFLSCLSIITLEDASVKEILLVVQGLQSISMTFLILSIFTIFRVYLLPYIECANQGSGNTGKIDSLFKDHNDYMESIQKKDGRIDSIIYSVTYIVLHEATAFLETMVHYNTAIWLMWGFICWAFTDNLATLLCFCIASVIQVITHKATASLVEKSMYPKKEEEKTNV